MNAIPYDSAEEEWDRYGEAGGDEELPGRPRRQYFNRWTAVLFAVVLGGAGFYAGVRVEKGQLASSSGSAAASRFASLLSSAGSSSSSRTGGRSGASPGTGSFAGRGGSDFGGGLGGFAAALGGGNAAVGTVSSVNGKTIYVRETSGNTVKVKLSKATKITKSVSVKKGRVYPGDSVVASGVKTSGGGLTATSLTDSGASGTGTSSSTTSSGNGGGSGGAAALRSLFGGGGG
jgi:hypothetical protein